MFEPVKYPQRIEPLVRFVEETEPGQIVPATCDKLCHDVSVDDMLLASALAATRSCDLPPVHHGGSVHILSSMHAIHQMTNRLSEDLRFMPVVQNVALCNQHVHSPNTGPYILAEPAFRSIGLSVDEVMSRLEKSLQNGAYNLCEDYFLTLLNKLSPLEVLDELLKTAISKNVLDDHHVLFPVYTWRIIDHFGWEYGVYLTRPPVRFVTRQPSAPVMKDTLELISDYQLEERELRFVSGDDETQIIADLGIDIGDSNSFANVSVMLARSISAGLSLEGAGEALSIGASLLFLRWRTLRAMDAHLNLDAHIRRYIVRQSKLSLSTKLRALLTWHTGPDVRMALRHLGDIMENLNQMETSTVQQQSTLLQELDNLFQSVDGDVCDSNSDTDLEEKMDRIIALGFRYAQNRYDFEPLAGLISKYVCQDQFSEMHTYEHHQAMYEEIQTTRPALRWVHMVAMVKGAAISIQPNPRVFRQAKDYFENANSEQH